MATPHLTASEKIIFEPDSLEELLRGWMLHAHKGRDRHDAAARRCDSYRYLLGVPAVTFSAIVGTSVFASLGNVEIGAGVKISIGLISVFAAVLSSLQTFYNFADRAERHRTTGAAYKALIRELEHMLIAPRGAAEQNAAWVQELRKRLDALEGEAPVVPARVYDRIEGRYGHVTFVDKATELYAPKGT